MKPTQLGLDLDAAVCQRNLDRIVTHAEQRGNTPVWIDMESSPYVDPTLKLFRARRARRSRGVGLAMQAYLYRTAKDLEDLDSARSRPFASSRARISSRPMSPIPRSRTWTRTSTRSCLRLMAQDAQKRGSLVHIATHDVALADRLHRLHRREEDPVLGVRVRDAVRHPARSAAYGSPRAAVGCACSSATANTGFRGTCDDSPSARKCVVCRKKSRQLADFSEPR